MISTGSTDLISTLVMTKLFFSMMNYFPIFP